MMHPIQLLLVLLGLLAPLDAKAWSEDSETPEGWAWAQIKIDQIADFNQHCGKTLDPHSPDGWDDPCREVSPQFLVDVLTEPKWRNRIAQHGVRLRGTRIKGDIDLEDVEIVGEFWLEGSRLDGGLDLNDAHITQFFARRFGHRRGVFRVEVTS
jgi:hypothetical protein